MSFTSKAWKEAAAGTLLGAVPICLLVGLALVAGYGSIAIGGLAASTLLTLVVVPVAYTLVDDAQRAVLRLVSQGAARVTGRSA